MNEVESIVKKKRGASIFIYGVIKSIFWGLLFGLIINCVFWHEDGYRDLMINLNNTYYQQLNGISIRNKGDINLYQRAADHVNNWIYLVPVKLESLLNQISYFRSIKKDNNITKKSPGIEKLFDHFILVSVLTFKVIAVKTLSIFASFLLFVFSAILGAADGLLARYIRTNEGGRESTFVFHRVSETMVKIPIGILFLYLALPIFLNPEFIVLTMSILFFLFFYITTANLKKFL